MNQHEMSAKHLPSLDRARQLYRLNRNADALAETLKCLSNNPEDADALCLLALLHGETGDVRLALDAVSKAISYHPNDYYPHYVRALVYSWFNRNELALKSLKTAIQVCPTMPDLFELAGIIRYNQGKFSLSLATVRKGLKHNPRHTGCLYQMAMALRQLERDAEAEEVLRALLSIDPEHTQALGYFGRYMAQQGDYADALPVLRRALETNPDWKLAQSSWKEALRNRHFIYGSVVKFRMWMVETYCVRSWIVLFLLMVCLCGALRYDQALIDNGNVKQILGNAIIPAVFLTPLVYYVLIVLMSVYLVILKRVIFLVDPEIKRTYSKNIFRWKWEREGRPFLYEAIFWTAILASIVMIVVAIRSNR